MVNRNLIRNLESDHQIENLFHTAVADIEDPTAMIDLIDTDRGFEVNKIIEGRVIRIDEDTVLVDVGFKSEGSIPRHEWDDNEDPPAVGDIVKVLVEEVEEEFPNIEDPFSMVSLSRRKALKLIEWDNVMNSVKEGQVVTGTVTRKIKGGLLVDIGVNVFLPASQVDIRRPSDIGDYIGRTVQCIVLKIDDARRSMEVARKWYAAAGAPESSASAWSCNTSPGRNGGNGHCSISRSSVWMSSRTPFPRNSPGA